MKLECRPKANVSVAHYYRPGKLKHEGRFGCNCVSFRTQRFFVNTIARVRFKRDCSQTSKIANGTRRARFSLELPFQCWQLEEASWSLLAGGDCGGWLDQR
jgi:hypothetical protein